MELHSGAPSGWMHKIHLKMEGWVKWHVPVLALLLGTEAEDCWSEASLSNILKPYLQNLKN